MALAKNLVYGYTTGSTIYAIVVRAEDGYVLDDDDGTFKANLAACTDPYCDLTESATILGRYAYSTSASVWNDGPYTATIYLQAGGSPDVSADTVLETIHRSFLGDRAVDAGVSETIHAYALCSLAELKAEETITISDDDDRLIKAINAATDFAETFCNRKLKRRAAAITEYYDGDDTRDSYTQLWPNEWPLESDSITSLNDDPAKAWTGTAITAYFIERERYIALSDSGSPGSFNTGKHNIKLVYAPGYTTLPYDLKQAGILIAVDMFKAHEQSGKTSETIANQNVQYAKNKLIYQIVNPIALEILQHYRRDFEQIGDRHAWRR